MKSSGYFLFYSCCALFISKIDLLLLLISRYWIRSTKSKKDFLSKIYEFSTFKYSDLKMFWFQMAKISSIDYFMLLGILRMGVHCKLKIYFCVNRTGMSFFNKKTRFHYNWQLLLSDQIRIYGFVQNHHYYLSIFSKLDELRDGSTAAAISVVGLFAVVSVTEEARFSVR